MSCNKDALGSERLVQRAIKCAGSSGSNPHSLQIALPVAPRYLRARNRQASASRPSQPTRRRMRRLLSLVSFGRPMVTDQCD